MPSFPRRPAIQMLMRSQAVVPELKFGQRLPKSQGVLHDKLIEFFLQSAKQSFDAPVLPRMPWLAALMVDAQPSQPEPKQSRRETCFIIGLDRVWLTTAFDDRDQRLQQRQCGAIR